MYPKRKSTALPSYNYAQPGAYFITLCTRNRRPLFGGISPDGTTLLSPAGTLVYQEWALLAHRFPSLDPHTLNIFVVMPDHIHGILTITAGGASPSPTLHQILGTHKSITTIAINRLFNTPGNQIWQRSGYEHILRNQQDFNEAAAYIHGNPARWANTNCNILSQ